MTRTGNIRYICSFVKKNEDGELKPNVVVVAAANSTLARAVLCQKYNVINRSVSDNTQEGIKNVRQAETNIYEGETESENFITNSNNS